jgi:hypothetical protein
VPALFQPSPILQVQHLCLHLSTLKHEREWLADAVLATDTMSVDANRDNGASLRGTRKSRRARWRSRSSRAGASGHSSPLPRQDAGYGSRTTYLSAHSSEW